MVLLEKYTPLEFSEEMISLVWVAISEHDGVLLDDDCCGLSVGGCMIVCVCSSYVLL